jgi:hypothetical protein
MTVLARPAGHAARWGDVIQAGPGCHDDLTDQDAAIRRQVTAVRRLDVISLAGGTGCSTLAARLAVLYARRRGGRVLGVDAGPHRAFTRLADAAIPTSDTAASGPVRDEMPTSALARLLHTPATVNRAVEAIAGLPVGRAGLLIAEPDRLGRPSPTQWQATVGPMARFFDLVVTDWGHRTPHMDFETALSGTDAAVLVCRAGRGFVEQAVAVAAALNRQAPALVCVTDMNGVGDLAARLAQGWGRVPVVFLPFLSDPNTPTPPRRYRLGLIDAAARLMDMAAPTASPPVVSSPDPAELPQRGTVPGGERR